MDTVYQELETLNAEADELERDLVKFMDICKARLWGDAEVKEFEDRREKLRQVELLVAQARERVNARDQAKRALVISIGPQGGKVVG